ncbi:trypsin-like peptidase domain-containing protein [Patescibacteria group bacterium]|nr:trypsin-like peptidase domain-containing protein [Patescibacteria group bacterium]MCL5409369.1 trypsin-like peptidase domain-containing protein [Patescibacteria group bacterium]
MISKLAILFLLVFDLVIFGQLNGYVPLLNQGPTNSNSINTANGTTQSRSASQSVNLANSNSSNTLENVINQALPSVVTIEATTTNSSYQIEINPFNPFNPFRTVPTQASQSSQNIGSGFIVSASGEVLTNKHVIADNSATYTVITADGKKYPVVNIKTDPNNDLALLKINANSLTPITLGSSSNLQLGESVYAIGTPLGQFTNSVTNGIVSGLGRGITAGSPYQGYVEQLSNVIQTSAAINPGNSGGPLINSQGQVIGINTAIAASGQNIGFAIPVNVIKTFLSSQGVV